MKKITIICLTVVFTTLFCFGIVKAFSVGSGTLEVDSLKVGKQDEGGVTFFNGTIVNNTTFGSTGNNPVTFGDDVRIDGGIYRGLLGYFFDDDTPVKIYDNLNVRGTLILDRYDDGGTIISNWEDNIIIDESLWVEGDAQIDNNIVVGGNAQFLDYIQLPKTYAVPPDAICHCNSYTEDDCGLMIYEPISDNPKLWICGWGGWKSYSPD